MKQIVLLLILSTALFAGKKELDMLNAEMWSVQEKNRDIIDENKKLTTENKSLTGINNNLSSKVTNLEKQVSDLSLELKKNNAIIAQYKQNAIVAEKKVVEASRPAVSAFPLEGKILKKNAHDASNLAVLLTFYNGSAETLNGFSANLQFIQNGKILLECLVDIQKSFPSAENVTWYGAIPYSAADAANMHFFNANPESIDINVDVKSVVLTNGAVRKY
jgi:hypothetical protein